MTLSSLIRNECANYRKGNCVFQDKPCPVLSGAACNMSLIASRGGKAKEGDPSYFEAAVLPLCKSMPEYADAAGEYAAIVGGRVQFTLTRCECGEAKAHKKQYCEDCAKKRRKEKDREQYLKRKAKPS